MRSRASATYLAALSLALSLCACASPRAKTSAIPGVPEAIASMAGASIPIAVGDQGRCSAVRVSERWILTAAHCAVGHTGKEKRQMALLGEGVRYPLAVVETGDFRPQEGRLHDWAILTPERGTGMLSEVGVASFPTAAELKKTEDALESTNLRDGPAVWTITFPQPSVRIYPRPAPLGNGTFLSRGRLMNDRGYQRRTILLAQAHQLIDDRFGKRPGRFKGNIGEEWEKLKQNRQGLIGNLVALFTSYEEGGDPIWYHTADYANSSSGGGVFLERSGALLGIIPMSAAPFDARATYDGLGHLYRIDRICKESKQMAELAGCQALTTP